MLLVLKDIELSEQVKKAFNVSDERLYADAFSSLLISPKHFVPSRKTGFLI